MSSLSFIGIGAQKAGTTWLYDQLRQLKEFNLTPIKELHYFDRSPRYISPDYVEISKLRDRLRNWRWYRRVVKDFGRNIIREPLNFQDLRWLCKWHFANYEDKFYHRIFEEWAVKGIKGEITPSYSLLEKEDISRIIGLFPDIRIVFLIRDPIDRAWSHCRYRKPTVTTSIASIKSFINSDEQILRGDYVRTIENYTAIIPREQVLLAFYDGIRDNPGKLLEEIILFLGGDTSAVKRLNAIAASSNVSRHLEMPPEIRDHLLAVYEPGIEKLARDHGGYCDVWLQKHYNRTLGERKLRYTKHP